MVAPQPLATEAPDVTAAFRGARVLVTGGLGFIGSNLAHRLVAAGAEVTLADSLIPEYGGNLANIREIRDHVRVNVSDVRDEHSMRSLVRGVDYLFNLAGQTSHLDSMQDPYTDLDINCRAQLFILEACRRYNPELKLVFAGTRQIYGRPEYLPVDERHPLCPVDVNGINKMAGEWYHIVYSRTHGIRACSLRLTNTYGPRMRVKDARQTFVGVWIRRLLEGEAIEVWEGDQLRDFTYADDAVDALLLAAATPETDGRIYNLGGERPVRLIDLARLLIELNDGGEYCVRSFPPDCKRIDIGSYYADYGLFRSATGWEPRVPLREGFARTLAYYRERLQEYV
jgi:UDP-glucose 4-epimerase